VTGVQTCALPIYTFIAGSGADLIHGDGGSDTVSYEASGIGVTVNLAEDNNNTGTTVSGAGTPVWL